MPRITLFAGGFRDIESNVQWGTRFGSFNGTSSTFFAEDGADVDGQNIKKHAEAQYRGILGADFVYSARVLVNSRVDAHLQFRICDEGRYGIRLGTDNIAFYRFARQSRICSADSSVVAHCPNWKLPHDNPEWIEMRHVQFQTALNSGSSHDIEVRASGPAFDVLLDGQLMFGRPIDDGSFPVGRFGIYVWGDAEHMGEVLYSNIRATTDPAARSNLCLLYSIPGYEARGTKRALVRTLNDLPAEAFDSGRSEFTLVRSDGGFVKSEPLKALLAPSGGAVKIAKTFGMQLWEADFSSVTDEGSYILHVKFATPDNVHTLSTGTFEIRSRLVTSTMLKPLSILNGEARRAADEDFWRNWIRRSGDWSVCTDGAFFADRANNEEGTLLERVFDRNNGPSIMVNFRYVGRVSILSGCDAQMQFRITPNERWAVTLQAGEAGGCASGGPGAVRLHREVLTDNSEVQFEFLGAQFFPLKGFPDSPFRVGHSYKIEIVANGGVVTVSVDGIPQLENISVLAREGGFALKAWASTVRFEHVQAWEFEADLTRSPEGIVIPKNEAKHAWDAVPDANDKPVRADFERRCNPKFSQLHGFQDCNNIIGEATSHGAFLVALMDVWTRRAHLFTQDERERLRRLIITTTLYLGELYQQRGAYGEFAHSEMGRVAIYTNLGVHQTLLALYGESAFADKGSFVDRKLARDACERCIHAARRLWSDEIVDPIAQSIIYVHIARAARREKLASRTEIRALWQLASEAVNDVLSKFAAPEGIALEIRDTGRVIPWFEGVYEMLRSHPGRLESYSERLDIIVDALVMHLTSEHSCDDNPSGTARCAPNGFFVLPQASNDPFIDPDLPKMNWNQMDRVPRVHRSVAGSVLHFYECNHFAVAASEAAYLWYITKRDDLERVVSGNLHWVLGLNPGISTSKIAPQASETTPWHAASFVYNANGLFARTMEGHRTEPSSAKGWVEPWEDPMHFPPGPDSPHRETWWIDPQNRSVSPPNRSFQSIVNGHVIWDEQWDYWNTGVFGWGSAETFLRNDGTFLKAALLYEDGFSRTGENSSNPYNVNQLEFFDTSHLDRKNSGWVDRRNPGWGFDDLNRTEFAHACRAAHEFAEAKGYRGGRFTGHHVGERNGLWCFPRTLTEFFDTTKDDILETGWNFEDINLNHWALISRAATGFAINNGFVGAFFTGHQLLNPLRRGIICLSAGIAQFFDATDQDLISIGESFDDINTVPWAQAARAATNICINKGFVGGFFTGHRVPDKIGVIAFTT